MTMDWDTGGTLVEECLYIDGKGHGRVYGYVPGVTLWYGTTDETRYEFVGKDAHDAEIEAFRPKLDMALVIPWLIAAKRMGVSKDVARLIGEMLFDESDLQTAYWLEWIDGFSSNRVE
jgi:hypothetical protein